MSNSKIFRCEDCNYETDIKCNFVKHNNAKVHLRNVQNNNKSAKIDYVSDVDKIKVQLNDAKASIKDRQGLVSYDPILSTIGSYEYKSIRKYIDNNGKTTYINPVSEKVKDDDKLCLDLDDDNHIVFSSNTNLVTGFVKTDKYIDWLFFVHNTKSVIILRQNVIVPDVGDLQTQVENLEKMKLIKEKKELDNANESFYIFVRLKKTCY